MLYVILVSPVILFLIYLLIMQLIENKSIVKEYKELSKTNQNHNKHYNKAKEKKNKS